VFFFCLLFWIYKDICLFKRNYGHFYIFFETRDTLKFFDNFGRNIDAIDSSRNITNWILVWVGYMYFSLKHINGWPNYPSIIRVGSVTSWQVSSVSTTHYSLLVMVERPFTTPLFFKLWFFFFWTNIMCYHILLKKAPEQGQKQEVQDLYTLS
jgi:hypothetical protein